MKIDLGKWKKFHLYDENLFTIDSGSKLDKSKMTTENPTVLFVGRAYPNNGIIDVVDEIAGLPPYDAGNLTLSLGGELGACFVQDKPFYTSQNTIVLKPNRNISKSVKQFIATSIFRESKSRYKPFVDELNRHVKTDFSFYLPCTQNGDPDFEYMELYMENIKNKVYRSIKNLDTIDKKQAKKTDFAQWKDFRVGDLFEIHPTKAYKLTNAKLFDDGKTPVVVNSAYCNGIGGYTSLKPTESGNMLTFSDTVDANTIFYQENDFVGYPHLQGIYVKDPYVKNWNKECLLFFMVMLRKCALTKGFDYANKFRRDIAINMQVKLPVTNNGIPDFEYMEHFINNFYVKVDKNLNKLIQLL